MGVTDDGTPRSGRAHARALHPRSTRRRTMPQAKPGNAGERTAVSCAASCPEIATPLVTTPRASTPFLTGA